MGNKVTDELLSSVRSIFGSEYSDMDIIRALHMANNDVTAAINIIFDTPNFKSKVLPAVSKNPQPSRLNSAPGASTNPKQNGGENRSFQSLGHVANAADCASEGEGFVEDVRGRKSSVGSEWWFVGSGEISGLSTCKGRRLKPGDVVAFTFPLKSGSSLPSPGKAFSKGRQQAAACSEIVRFSTKESGEVTCKMVIREKSFDDL